MFHIPIATADVRHLCVWHRVMWLSRDLHRPRIQDCSAGQTLQPSGSQHADAGDRRWRMHSTSEGAAEEGTACAGYHRFATGWDGRKGARCAATPIGPTLPRTAEAEWQMFYGDSKMTYDPAPIVADWSDQPEVSLHVGPIHAHACPPLRWIISVISRMLLLQRTPMRRRSEQLPLMRDKYLYYALGFCSEISQI